MTTAEIKKASLKELMQIPGVGKSIANDLWEIGIHKIPDLKNKNPQKLYEASNKHAGMVQDRCLLYVFRCAVYFASNSPVGMPLAKHQKEKLNWWWWKDNYLKKQLK